jgi:hypothetical protein
LSAIKKSASPAIAFRKLVENYIKNIHLVMGNKRSFKSLSRFTVPLLPKTRGKKELIGRTDVDIEISNQCGRLVANLIIYYNSALLSL